jgi:hypothetical protein
MDEIDASGLDYPLDAEHVRNLIRDMLRSQVDHGSSMDTGGGFGSADLFVTFDGKEYAVSVSPARG